MHYIFKILVSVLILLFFSCKEADITNSDPKQSITSTQYNDPLLKFLIDLGFPSSSIEDMDTYFLVEKDMIFKKDVLKFYQQKRKQRQYRFTVDTSKVRDITVNTEDLRDKGTWEVSFMAAVDHWNNVSNSKLSFIINNSIPEPDITIFANELSNLRLEGGRSEVPDSLGNPGKSLTVEYDPELDPKYENTNPQFNERTAIAVHELGHTIGLAHTDSPVSSQVQIRCTPLEDDLSIMDKDVLTLLMDRSNLSLTLGDKLSIQSLYPADGFELNCTPTEELSVPESPVITTTFESNDWIQIDWSIPNSDAPVINYIFTRYNMGYDGTIKDGRNTSLTSNSLRDFPKDSPNFSSFKSGDLGFACYSVVAQSIVGNGSSSKVICYGVED